MLIGIVGRVNQLPPGVSVEPVLVLNLKKKNLLFFYIFIRAQELCESQGGRPQLPVPDIPYGLCGHKATFI